MTAIFRGVVLAAVLVSLCKAELPSLDVSDYSSDDLDELIRSFPKEDRGGWWLQVGDTLYSPALGDSLSGAARLGQFHIVLGVPKLPPKLQKVRVGGDNARGIHIVETGNEAAKVLLRGFKSARVEKIESGMKLFVPFQISHQRAAELKHRNLERSLEEEELHTALARITNEYYGAELNRITLTGSGPEHQRNVVTDGHRIAEKFLSCRMRENGFNVQLVPVQLGSEETSGMDVLGCRPGQSEEFMIVGAHFDTLPGPPAQSPGAMDNGSGVAVVMAVMEAIADLSFEKTVCIAAFDGEELGCLGSAEIARQISSSEKLKNKFLGAVTSDMATGFVKSVETSRSPGWDAHNSKILQSDPTNPLADGIHIDGGDISSQLIDAFGEAAKKVASKNMPVLTSKASLWNSDHKSFLRNGLPAIDICAANHRSYAYWHNTKNTTDNLDMTIGAEITRTTVAALFQLAGFKGMRDTEADTDAADLMPRFNGAVSPEESFDSLDCTQILSDRPKQQMHHSKSKKETEVHSSHKQAKDKSVVANAIATPHSESHQKKLHPALQAHKNAKGKLGVQSRLALIGEMEEAIADAEKELKKHHHH